MSNQYRTLCAGERTEEGDEVNELGTDRWWKVVSQRIGMLITDRSVPHRRKIPGPTGIEAIVCADIAERQRLGVAKYGTTVKDNPLTAKQWAQHAYEECLDQAVYLRRLIDEL
jgi:hypothetical protein